MVYQFGVLVNVIANNNQRIGELDIVASDIVIPAKILLFL